MESAPVDRAAAAAITRVIRAIPKGRVATSGQVAELAGLPRRHRLVARVLRYTDPKRPLPWQRVVGKRSARLAQISIPDAEGAREQRRRLEAEGVRFTASGGIRLLEHGWLPAD